MSDFAAVLKYNPYHDARGRFTSHGSAKTHSPYSRKRRGGTGPVKVEAKAKEPEPTKDEPKEEKVTPKKVLEAGPKKKPVASKPKLKEKKPTADAKPKEEPKAAEKPAKAAAPDSDEAKIKAYVAEQSQRAKQYANVVEDYMRGGIVFTDLQKAFYGIPLDVKPGYFGVKTKKPKPEAKAKPEPEAKPKPSTVKPGGPSDVTSDDPHTQAFVNAQTVEEIQASMKEMGWQDIFSATTFSERRKMESKNGEIADNFRKKLFKALKKAPRGAVTVKTFRNNLITDETAQKLQDKANLLLHPKIASLLSHPSVKVLSQDVQGGLASFRRESNAISLDTAGETKSEVDAIYVHEFGHKVETQVKGLLGTAKRLRSKYNREQREMVTEYAHRVYGGNKGTEVISTGFEHYWRDPLGFAERAPEQFALIHGLVMRGEF